MNIHHLTEQSIMIITEYYKNNLNPYFDNVDDDILWIGSARGQWLRGKKALMAAWEKESHELTFSMNNITSSYITSASQYCEIVLTYEVVTHYPDGHTVSRNQILHYTWCERKIINEQGLSQKIPRILMIHISNTISYDSRDTIYPVHLPKPTIPKISQDTNEVRLLVSGQNRFTYSVPIAQIAWIESTEKGLHSIIHTESEILSIYNSVSSLSTKYSDHLIQIHISYLVNPLFVRSIKRFEVELYDGILLPIPQKKYTKVKAQIETWILQWNRRR